MGKDAFDGSKENASRFLLFLVLRNRFFPLCSLPFSSCSLLLHRQTFFHALRNFLFAHLASLFRPIDFAKTPHYRAPPCIFAPFHTVAFGSPSDHVRRSEGWRLMVTSWLLYGYMCRLYSSNYFFFLDRLPPDLISVSLSDSRHWHPFIHRRPRRLLDWPGSTSSMVMYMTKFFYVYARSRRFYEFSVGFTSLAYSPAVNLEDGDRPRLAAMLLMGTMRAGISLHFSFTHTPTLRFSLRMGFDIPSLWRCGQRIL